MATADFERGRCRGADPSGGGVSTGGSHRICTSLPVRTSRNWGVAGIFVADKNLLRFEIYEKIAELALRAALLDLFTDVVEFSVKASARNSAARPGRAVTYPISEEFGDILARLRRHTQSVNETGYAIHIRATEEFYEGTEDSMPTLAAALGHRNWIWTGPTFVQWVGPSPSALDRFLCIFGIYGCGKEPIYYIIDRVDECNDSIRESFGHASRLLHGYSNFHVAPLGRSHVLQPQMLRAARGVTARAIEIAFHLNRQDIDTSIGDAIEKSEVSSQLGLRGVISDTLRTKPDGIFL
ncbi:hypothetical protein FGG08_003734 [Glutinoglossum americanum]|uniref:Uncharacterized protein n=1 Tax=Glutinoglossum americanum TaxID=1670608 RepID=A0A9P8I243_9PEZI|nr:hypothetical protein FGG08_003734 [Glutinoglossum americanum]